MSDIKIEYEQGRTCSCKKGSVATYRVVGLNILSPRAYDKESAETIAKAWQEIEDLTTVAKENADIANERAKIIVDLKETLRRLQERYDELLGVTLPADSQ